jgi:phosphoribosylglycinamide formyltransferase-1
MSTTTKGQVIFQAFTRIAENDSPEDIASKVHALEYAHYPKVIHQILGGADEV